MSDQIKKSVKSGVGGLVGTGRSKHQTSPLTLWKGRSYDDITRGRHEKKHSVCLCHLIRGRGWNGGNTHGTSAAIPWERTFKPGEPASKRIIIFLRRSFIRGEEERGGGGGETFPELGRISITATQRREPRVQLIEGKGVPYLTRA